MKRVATLAVCIACAVFLLAQLFPLTADLPADHGPTEHTDNDRLENPSSYPTLDLHGDNDIIRTPTEQSKSLGEGKTSVVLRALAQPTQAAQGCLVDIRKLAGKRPFVCRGRGPIGETIQCNWEATDESDYIVYVRGDQCVTECVVIHGLAPGTSKDLGDIRLESGVRLSVVVESSVSLDARTVTIENLATHAIRQATLADSRAEFGLVYLGRWKVSVGGVVARLVPGELEMALGDGPRVVRIAVEEDGALLVGQVRDSAAHGIPGMQIRWSEDPKWVSSDATGRFSVRVPRQADVRLVIRDPLKRFVGRTVTVDGSHGLGEIFVDMESAPVLLWDAPPSVDSVMVLPLNGIVEERDPRPADIIELNGQWIARGLLPGRNIVVGRAKPPLFEWSVPYLAHAKPGERLRFALDTQVAVPLSCTIVAASKAAEGVKVRVACRVDLGAGSSDAVLSAAQAPIARESFWLALCDSVTSDRDGLVVLRAPRHSVGWAVVAEDRGKSHVAPATQWRSQGDGYAVRIDLPR